MAGEWIAPVTGWVAGDAPTGVDLNRIENNILNTHNGLLAEATARIDSDNTITAAYIAAMANGSGINLENRTSDPSSAAVGHMWIRTDL